MVSGVLLLVAALTAPAAVIPTWAHDDRVITEVALVVSVLAAAGAWFVSRSPWAAKLPG